ncbi:MAG: hypothetical protein R3Y63_12880 [Eubacteriales bacterium]
MDLSYQLKNISDCVDITLEFVDENQAPYWSDVFFEYYPDINRREFEVLSLEKKRIFLTTYFEKLCEDKESLLSEKLKYYESHWELHKNQVIDALENAFDTDLKEIFNDTKGNISFFPICPRYLSEHSFDVFYQCSEKGALGIALHEIIHFIWFHVWNEFFDDDISEYETPHLKWILSEMVVDCIMRDERLSTINPYFEEGCAYSYFYTMKIEEIPILETLFNMYRSMKIQDFMKKSYEYCLEWETEIRDHIQQAENG